MTADRYLRVPDGFAVDHLQSTADKWQYIGMVSASVSYDNNTYFSGTRIMSHMIQYALSVTVSWSAIMRLLDMNHEAEMNQTLNAY